MRVKDTCVPLEQMAGSAVCRPLTIKLQNASPRDVCSNLLTMRILSRAAQCNQPLTHHVLTCRQRCTDLAHVVTPVHQLQIMEERVHPRKGSQGSSESRSMLNETDACRQLIEDGPNSPRICFCSIIQHLRNLAASAIIHAPKTDQLWGCVVGGGEELHQIKPEHVVCSTEDRLIRQPFARWLRTSKQKPQWMYCIRQEAACV